MNFFLFFLLLFHWNFFLVIIIIKNIGIKWNGESVKNCKTFQILAENINNLQRIKLPPIIEFIEKNPMMLMMERISKQLVWNWNNFFSLCKWVKNKENPSSDEIFSLQMAKKIQSSFKIPNKKKTRKWCP